jgi:hypothetical protein
MLRFSIMLSVLQLIPRGTTNPPAPGLHPALILAGRLDQDQRADTADGIGPAGLSTSDQAPQRIEPHQIQGNDREHIDAGRFADDAGRFQPIAPRTPQSANFREASCPVDAGWF